MIQEDDKIILYSEHVIKLNPQNYYLINVGSVGQPRDLTPVPATPSMTPVRRKWPSFAFLMIIPLLRRRSSRKTCRLFWHSDWKKEVEINFLTIALL